MKTPMDRKIKHLEFIQGVINRLASDSFRMKGWCVALVAALFILLAREGRIEFVGVALVPILFFWGLDGRQRAQERLFANLASATFSRALFVFYGAQALAIARKIIVSQAG